MNTDCRRLATVAGIIILVAAQSALAASGGDPKKGAKAFQKATCANCHPGGGNVVNPKDPLKGPKFARQFKDDAKIVRVVRNGIKGTAMEAFPKKLLSDKDLKDIIAYIRTLTPKSSK